MKAISDFTRRLRKQAQRSSRYFSHIKFAEPILIFESDDWGLERKRSLNLVEKFGKPGEWAKEQTESVEDLQGLYEILERHHDAKGRPACFTANFIMANADYDRIERERFEAYHDITLDVSLSSQMVQQYREGVHRKCFFPQYHGRTHFWPERWLKDLRENVPGSRELFHERCHGGLSLLEAEDGRYHSEYIDWKSGETASVDSIIHYMKEDLAVFEKLFGFQSLSTIPPHYIFTPEAEKAWKQMGIRSVQGAGFGVIREMDASSRIRCHYLGEVSPEGLIYSFRTVKFDPRPSRPKYQWQSAFNQIEERFKQGLPAIVDTHRINYTGPFRDESLRQLDLLLQACKRYEPLFLNSVELGDAISGNGKYADTFEQKVYHLRPIENIFQPVTRRLNRYLH